MAASSLKESLSGLEREITCGICQEFYEAPKVLPCCHYYCKECIFHITTRSGQNQPFPCPECRRETILPEGGVDDLPTAFFINRLKSAFLAISSHVKEVATRCEACANSSEAASFCRHCVKYLCEECTQSHQKMKSLFVGHDVIPLQKLSESSIEKCSIHNNHLQIFCFDCIQLICQVCTLKDHRDHHFETIGIAGPRIKEELLKDLEPLRKMDAELCGCLEMTRTTKQKLEIQRNLIFDRIKNSFEQLHQILEKRKKEMLEEAKGQIEAMMYRISMQEAKLASAISEIQGVMNQTMQSLRHVSNPEILSTHMEIKNDINRELERRSETQKNVDQWKEVEVGVEVNIADELQQLCQTKAMIIRTPLSTDKYEISLVSKPFEVELSFKLDNRDPINKTFVVNGHLKSLYNGSTVKYSKKQVVTGEYRVQYIPTVRGRHQLTVSVEGKELAGSPFPLFVSIPSNQLGKPVMMWRDVNRPSSLAVTSAGEVIVAQFLGDVVIFDKEGRRLRSILNREQQLFKRVCGVTVNKEGKIYFVTADSSKIFTESNGVIEKKEVDQHDGPGFESLAIVGDEVMAIESGNKGAFMVYNMNLCFIRRVTDSNAGTFYDLSPDRYGSVYITDYGNSCIRVFSNAGYFLRSFGHMNLKKPHYLCVADQCVYVTDGGKHCVSIFSTEGAYLSSFGNYGHKEGLFVHPWGVTADADGFLYVCDYVNNRVQVF